MQLYRYSIESPFSGKHSGCLPWSKERVLLLGFSGKHSGCLPWSKAGFLLSGFSKVTGAQIKATN